MSYKIYQLHYDFVQQDGNYIAFLENGGHLLQSDDLATIQVKMIQVNSLPKILPLQVEDIDFNVKLYYNFTGKKKLAQVLRESKLTIEQYYQLLFDIVSVVEKSKEFMLNEQNYILQEDFIFVGSNLGDLYLIYLPLKEISGKPNIGDELKNLVINLVGQIQELRGEGVQHLINILNAPTLNLGHLKAKLDELRKRALVANTGMNAPQPVQTHPFQEPEQQVSYQPRKDPVFVQPVVTPRQEQVPVKPQNQKPADKKKSSPPNVKAPEKQNKPESVVAPAKAPPKKIVVISLLVLSFALIYKLYEVMPSEGMIYICSGLGLLAITVAYYFSAIRILPNKISAPASSPVGGTGNAKGKKAAKTDDKEVPSVQVARVEEAKRSNEAAGYQVAPGYDNRDYYESLGNKTIMISEENKTARLVEEATGPLQKSDPYLEITRNNKIEKISIALPKFTIGRNPQSVNYIEDTIGISRMHIEFERKDGQVFLKDLNSRNGTQLNHEKLVPYKQYPLKNGDQIEIGRVHYIFKIDS